MHLMQSEFPKLKGPSINPRILIVLVLIIAVVGGTVMTRFITSEQNRELLLWQNKLGLIADSRAADVDAWVERHFKELGDVVGNPSLQLYLTELLGVTDIRIAEEPPQAVYMRNLLSITADRLGFIARASKEMQSINASVSPPSGVGLAIIDRVGKILVSTSGLPAFDPILSQKVEEAPKGQSALIDIFKSENGKNRIGFVLPIFPVQTEGEVVQPIGMLVGIKNVDDALFKLLRHPGTTEKTLEAVLLRREGDNVAYLSPQDNEEDAAPKLALNTPDLDAAFAVTSPGEFAVKRNADSQLTLVTSRSIAKTPWTMMLHVNRNQAMLESDVRLRQIQFSLFLGLLAMIGGIVSVWYYGTSKRTLLLSLETQRMASRSAAQEKLLRVVADNQLEPIVIADNNNIARFANAKAAKAFRLTAPDVAGKALAALMGASYAKGYEEANKTALTRQAPFVRTWSTVGGAGAKVIHSEHIPLAHVPVEGLPVPTPGVLMIDQDITEIVNEREHRMRILRQVITMLVTMVDRRDPYAACHSACVALVARSIASDMGLDNGRIETAETAGNLMNIGKIIVPSEVLMKPSALTQDEMKQVHESMQSSIGLLEKVEFDGPVVDTLRQAQEHYDGSGPLKLKGEDILITARIIAVANAFVGMISKRSYRQALEIDNAIKILLEQIGTNFDRRVVITLAAFVENKQGREEIKKLIPSEPIAL
ncbi:MAG: HD domain-containing phosphohydrolase [Bdellovibrionales bacterium]